MPAADRLIDRIEQRLLAEPERAVQGALPVPDWVPERPFERDPVDAAVLIALVRRDERVGVLYTERSSDLRAHSGQIAFPGGKIDPGDKGAAEAALREAWEEVALHREEARILGYLPNYFTGSNYLITPVVALVTPTRPFLANPAEVRSVFEVPLFSLMDDRNYGRKLLKRGSVEHSTWQILHEDFSIWGITANLTRRFYDLALKDEKPW